MLRMHCFILVIWNFTKIYNNLSKNIIQNTEYRDGYIKGNIT